MFKSKWNQNNKERNYYTGMPIKYFDCKSGRYIDLTGAKEIERRHGISYDPEFLDIEDDIGATVLIIEKKKKFYLIIKNAVHGSFKWENLEENLRIYPCRSLDEARHIASTHMEWWQ